MLNSNFQKLKSDYIFPVIEKKLEELKQQEPHLKIHNLGVGDVALPLAPKIAEAICLAAQEMSKKVRGYGPSGGYPFLREAICASEYSSFGIEPEEIFISDGANTDTAYIQEIFDEKTPILVTDPTYPVYRDTTLLNGKNLQILPLLEKENFIPHPPKKGGMLVYLCTPCNPTGIALNQEVLNEWVHWARKSRSILVIDNVYNTFISSADIPSSIYTLKGAKEVAIEVRSFSKSAGFTGLRCGYMVIPKELHQSEIHKMWKTRIDIKTNGISYPIQKGAEACFSPEGRRQLFDQISSYKTSMQILSETLSDYEQTFFGGKDAPYIWWKAPPGKTAWEFFDDLLQISRIVSIPGTGFGPSGEGYVRLSCFLSPSLAKEAAHALHYYFTTV